MPSTLHPHRHEPADPHIHQHEGTDPLDHAHGRWNRLKHALAPHSHDPSDSLDEALESSARGIRAVRIGLVGLGATALAQLLVVVASGSVALFADTVHNFSDALTAVPLWFAFILGRRAATRRYTHGFGRAEDLAGLFVVAMIALSAVLAAWQAVERLLHPAPVHNLGWVALAGFVGFAGNEAVALFRVREGRAIGSAALVADGHNARTDGYTSLAVLVGAAGVAVGWAWADPVVGLLITVVILMVLRTAARDVFRRLMDGVEPEMLDAAEAALTRVAGVLAVEDARMRWIGHEIHVEAVVKVDPDLTLAAAEAVALDAEQHVVDVIPRVTRAAVRARRLVTSR